MSDHFLAALWFWLSLGIVFYTFLGYPLLILVVSRLHRRPASCLKAADLPSVSVVLVVANEAERVVSRLQNLLESDYPAEKLEIVLVSDGSTDATVDRVRTIAGPRLKLVVLPSRRGKAAGINAGVGEATGEVVVFADARQRFESSAIGNLARNFQDANIGAVSGNYSADPAAGTVGGGVDAYWRLEKLIRHQESQIDSTVGCTGAIYAIRRALFRALPEDTILDDVVIPMRVVLQGYRVIFEPEARAFDPQAVEPEREYIRKRRTLAGNYQMFFRHPGWLLPWRNRVWWQLVSHKYLRLTAPVFLLAQFAANAALLANPIYLGIFIGQCSFYLLALAGICFRKFKIGPLTVPAGFVFLNAMALAGLWHYLTRPAIAGWDRHSFETGSAGGGSAPGAERANFSGRP